DPTIAVHVDGVYQPRVGSLLGVYEDLSSIEVLRGPQGTLYGRGATGGSINIVTAKPSETFEGAVGVVGGNYDRWGAKGYVSGPVNENVLFRLFGLYDEQSEGYTKNDYPGAKDGNSHEVKAVRGALTLLPTDALTVDLKVSYEERESTYMAGAITPPLDLLWPIYKDAPYTIEPHRVSLDSPNEDLREDVSVTAIVDWVISDGITLRSTTGYLSTELQQTVDGDGT